MTERETASDSAGGDVAGELDRVVHALSLETNSTLDRMRIDVIAEAVTELRTMSAANESLRADKASDADTIRQLIARDLEHIADKARVEGESKRWKIRAGFLAVEAIDEHWRETQLGCCATDDDSDWVWKLDVLIRAGWPHVVDALPQSEDNVGVILPIPAADSTARDGEGESEADREGYKGPRAFESPDEFESRLARIVGSPADRVEVAPMDATELQKARESLTVANYSDEYEQSPTEPATDPVCQWCGGRPIGEACRSDCPYRDERATDGAQPEPESAEAGGVFACPANESGHRDLSNCECENTEAKA